MRTPMQIVAPLGVLPATETTFNLQAQKIDATSYDEIVASRIFVIRLECFKHWKVEFTEGPLRNTLANPNWFNLESGVPSVLPAVESTILLLARACATGSDSSISTFQRIRETSAGTNPYDTNTGASGGHSSDNSFSYMQAVKDVVDNAAVAYTLDNQCEAGYSFSPFFTKITFLLLGEELNA
jgi:hypothetical protein